MSYCKSGKSINLRMCFDPFLFIQNVMRCVIWYHLYNLKNVKITHGGVLILIKLQAFTKINTPPWVVFTFCKLYKWYQIAHGTKNDFHTCITCVIISTICSAKFLLIVFLCFYFHDYSDNCSFWRNLFL